MLKNDQNIDNTYVIAYVGWIEFWGVLSKLIVLPKILAVIKIYFLIICWKSDDEAYKIGTHADTFAHKWIPPSWQRFLLIKSDSNSSYLDNDKDKEERQDDSY